MSFNVVLLGATGRVGRLLRAAFKLHPTTRAKIWQQSRHPELAEKSDWFCWNADTGADGLARLADKCGGIDCIVNFAGVTPSTANGDYSDNSAVANASITAAEILGVKRLFLASSAAVYGVGGNSDLLSEVSTPAPASVYGRAKLEMESLALAHNGNAAITILRIGNVMGADMLMQNARAATTASPLMLDRFADGRAAKRSYIGPVSLAAVLNTLLGRVADERPLPDVVNVASPGAVLMSDLLAAYARAVRPVPWRWQAAGQSAMPAVCLDTKVLQSLHQFQAVESTAGEMVRQLRRCEPVP